MVTDVFSVGEREKSSFYALGCKRKEYMLEYFPSAVERVQKRIACSCHQSALLSRTHFVGEP